jgi:cell division protein FtsZ
MKDQRKHTHEEKHGGGGSSGNGLGIYELEELQLDDLPPEESSAKLDAAPPAEAAAVGTPQAEAVLEAEARVKEIPQAADADAQYEAEVMNFVDSIFTQSDGLEEEQQQEPPAAWTELALRESVKADKATETVEETVPAQGVAVQAVMEAAEEPRAKLDEDPQPDMATCELAPAAAPEARLDEVPLPEEPPTAHLPPFVEARAEATPEPPAALKVPYEAPMAVAVEKGAYAHEKEEAAAPEPAFSAVSAAPRETLTVSLAEEEAMEFIENIPHGANIKVVGVGGAGCNALNRMIASGVRGVQFIAANTDCQSLRMSKAGVKIQLGAKLTKGLGAGTDPEVGYRAAEEANDQLLSCLEGADMVFVTAGFGKGTGTGAAPYIAAMANQLGALTVAVVCTPFEFEGSRKMENAMKGLEKMRQVMSSVMVIIPNEKLSEVIGEDIEAKEAFRAADDVLCQATRSISDLITIPGEVNLDFADVRHTLQGQGKAFMGVGEAEGADRAAEAVRRALHNPLLSNADIQDAKAVLLNVTTGPDVRFHEIKQVANLVRETVKNSHTPCNWGWVPLEEMRGKVRVTVIAAGLDEPHAAAGRFKGSSIVAIDGRALKEHEIPTPKAATLGRAVPADTAGAPSYALPEETFDEPTFLRRQKAGAAMGGFASPRRSGLFGGKHHEAKD